MIRSIALLLAAAGLAGAQAMVEYGLGMGRAATGTAPASGLWENVQKALTGLPAPAAAAAVPAAATAKAARASAVASAAKPAPIAVVYEDSAHIERGMELDEIVGRFGPPVIAVTTAPGNQTLLYGGKDGRIEVELRGGKVVGIQPRKPAPEGSPTFRLPG